MRDRVSTKILSNGATRYGVYDETGKLLRYEYIKLEDEPSEEGDFFNKANMLPDSIPAALGLKMENPQVKDALNVLANVGNLHVWERVQSGVTDYLTSTDRNAYHDNVTDAQDAYYTFGDVVSGTIVPVTTSQVQFKYSTTVTVYDNGDLNVDGDVVNLQNYNTEGTSTIKGKYIVPVTTGASISGVWFIPSDATFSLISEDGNPTKQYLYCDKMQPVTGHAAIPANTTITYLGQLGNRARIEVGSYVGTGTYGSSNPNTLTFGFEPQLVAIFAPAEEGNNAAKLFMLRNVLGASILDFDGNNYGVIVTWSEKSVSWHTYLSSSSALGRYTYQMNSPEYTYHYIAIG